MTPRVGSPPMDVAVLLVAMLLSVFGLAACGGGGGSDEADTSFVGDIVAAIDAVEAERGGPQEYFEVTASALVTNVFVAIDDATAAVPYAYVGGELQAPAPVLTGASGHTFTADSVDFDEETVLNAVVAALPDATVNTLSVEGGDNGAVRYIVNVRSTEGGEIDITVGPDGTVLSVDPT